MRPLRILLAVVLTVGVVQAQAPYPTTPAPQPTWGGYALSPQVPHQPTLPSAIEPAAPGNVPPVWQPYPADGAGATVVAPDGAPAFVPQTPIYPYPSMPEPSLRESLIPPDAREGFFQKARLTGTWIPQLDSDSLGWTDLRAEVMTALPFFTRENPILITPSYELHFLDRPAGFDLPPRLHDLEIDFHVFRVFGNHWIADFAVTPGIFADDHSFDRSDALRVNGRAVGVYAPTIDLKWVLGLAYVDGAWNKLVPIAGVVFEPSDDVKYELVFPQPRVAWRLPTSPVPGHDEYWFYMMGEFANAIWAFQQSDGTPDVLAYRDFRFIVGLERKIIGGLNSRFEVGYVFNRDIRIASRGRRDIGMKDSILLRAGIIY